MSIAAAITAERAAVLKARAYIVPLSFGRARIVTDHPFTGCTYDDEFW